MTEVADLPYFAWLGPFALYLGVLLCRAAPNLYWRLLLIMTALAGNILLLKGYGQAMAALWRLQRAREGGYSLSDSPPPQDWEWALAGYIVAAAGLYFLLHVLAQLMARREAEAAERSGGDAPGLEH